MLHNQCLQGPEAYQNPVIIAYVLSADSGVKADHTCVLVHRKCLVNVE